MPPSKLTVRAFLNDEWLPAIAGTVRPLTLTQYTSTIKNRIVPRIGHMRLQAVSGGHLNAPSELGDGTSDRDGLSPASLRLTHAVLSRAFRDAVRWGKLVRSPAAAADPPAPSETRAHAFTAKELSRLLAQVKGDRLYPLWRLAATTGMRRGELLGLTWLALDLDAGTLRVDQQLVPTRGGVSFGAPKSKRSRRTIALDAGDGRSAPRAPGGAAARAGLRRRCVRSTTISCSLTRSASRSTRSASPNAFTQAAQGGRARDRHACTSCATRTPRSRSRTASRCTSSPLGSATGRKPILRTYAHLLPQSDVEAAQQVAALLAR